MIILRGENLRAFRGNGRKNTYAYVREEEWLKAQRKAVGRKLELERQTDGQQGGRQADERKRLEREGGD